MIIEDLENKIIEGNFDFYESIIILNEQNTTLTDLHLKKFSKLKFKKCSFKGKELHFFNIKNEYLKISFEDCKFECDLNFTSSNLNSISFKNIKTLKSLSLEKNILKYFHFLYDYRYDETETYLNSKFQFDNNSFNLICFDKLTMSEGYFSFTNNLIGDKSKQHNDLYIFNSFTNSLFFNFSFEKNTSYENLDFSDTKFKYYDGGFLRLKFNRTTFYKNIFRKANFNNVEFINLATFEDCKFLSTFWFEKCKNITNSNLKFVACEFNGFVLFNRSALKFLNIDRCTFDKSVSFTEAFFIKIKLFEVKFNGGAYFDEMRINNIDNKSYLKENDISDWKRTLRAIKQELQKTENKIDFNRFRAYELAAHYEELSWNWKYGFKDKFILWATKWSTDYGSSWIRAFWFTIVSGVGFYLIFYLTENYNHTADFHNWENWTRFTSGLFRFFLVTDFFNPLEKDRVYLINPLSWLIFIFGKIVIAFGIYEMIQSFRKFKA